MVFLAPVACRMSSVKGIERFEFWQGSRMGDCEHRITDCNTLDEIDPRLSEDTKSNSHVKMIANSSVCSAPKMIKFAGSV